MATKAVEFAGKMCSGKGAEAEIWKSELRAIPKAEVRTPTDGSRGAGNR